MIFRSGNSTNLDELFDGLLGDIEKSWTSAVVGALVHRATCVNEEQYDGHDQLAK